MNLQDENFKKEMDQHIGVSPLVTNNDSDRFNEWLKQPQVKKQKRYLIPKMLTIILFLGIAYVVYDVLQSNNSSFLFTGSKHSTGDNLTKPWEIEENIEIILNERYKDGFTLTILNNNDSDLNNNHIEIYNGGRLEEGSKLIFDEQFELKRNSHKEINVNIPFDDNQYYRFRIFRDPNVKENTITQEGPLGFHLPFVNMK